MNEFEDPVGPDEAELPDETPNLESIDAFETDPGEFEDINEFVKEEWDESTTGRERVEAIIQLARSPMTVSDIAELAEVSEPTARDQLARLVDQGRARAEPSDRGTLYQRDPDWHRLQRIRRLADEPKSKLEQVLRDLQTELNTYRGKYETQSPDDLIFDGERELDDEAWADISHWRTAESDIEYIRLALGLKRISVVEDKHEGATESSFGLDRDRAVHGPR